MSGNNSSSLQGYIDAAAGSIQSAIGSLTGSDADKAKGEQTRTEGHAEKDLSHSVGKVGPFAVSGSGGVSQDHPDRTEGSWNQTIGSAKESLGGLLGAQGLKQEGIQQNREGKGQEAHGQLSDLGGGMTDRAKGAAGSAFAGLTGNKEDQEKYQQKHDTGKTQQRSAEADIQKQSDY
ncbi:CsbD-like [Lasallia pustulata]|uniref:CsbD-like n=1 Tax=Lasallia pustulata TaxID=136370 RepID=A0A1W5CZ99_9LECA|nr:CsbD-like [Lasallia pustulata]